MEKANDGGDKSSSSIQVAGEAIAQRILRLGVDGFGPFLGAKAVAGEQPANYTQRERQIARIVATHRRLVGVGGFVTGFGGLPAMVLTLPADMLSFYGYSARMTGAIAYLRGYDVDSEEVQSVILVSLLGAAGVGALGEAGVQIGTKAATAALKGLPGSVLTQINQRVGFRLITKFGTKGAVNLSKAIPVLGGGVGAGINISSINMIARYAKSNFPPMEHSEFF